MSKIFLKIVSFVFLTGLFLTAYPVEAQQKKRVTKKPATTSKTKTSPTKTTSTKQTAPKAIEVAAAPTVTPNRSVQTLLTRIETNTGIFRRELTRALVQNNLSGTDVESSINAYISDFENAERMLKNRVDNGTDSVADVRDLLNRADFIQNFMLENDLSATVQSQWKILTDNLVTLANSYNVSWNINTTPTQTNRASNQQPVQNNQPIYPNNQQQQPNYSNQQPNNYSNPRFDAMLTGTYRLNVSQSDDVMAVLDRTFGNNTINNQNNNIQVADRMRRNLERRLEAPNMLVIDKRNNQVTMASDLSPQVSFSADNVERTEVNPNGRTIRVKAAALSNVMEISYQGDRQNDFFMTFLPVDNGQLRVTRRVYLEDRNQTVTVTSVYDKILPTADFSVVNNNLNTAGQYNQNNPNTQINSNTTISNEFVVPNGTQMIAALTSAISTQTLREGDRFTMEVRLPSQYSGAVIEGYVSNTQQSTRTADRAQVTFNFDKITLRNGNAYRFAGIINAVRLPNGDLVNVINETVANQSTRQTTRPGVGGALGAILGAIITGSGSQNTPAEAPRGTGSGTIVLQGQDNLELQQGSEFRIISSSPANTAPGN
jgi:hypothetical protein